MKTYLVVGLGNPDEKYLATRHNLGCLFLDALAVRYRCRWESFKHTAMMTDLEMGDAKLILIKPLTYMNESGEAVQAMAAYFKIPVSNIIVAYDDLSLEAGRLRLAINTSSGGHNGIKSVIQHLGSSDFIRLRLGIGPQKGPSEKFVLTRIPTVQKRIITDTFGRGILCLESLVTEGLAKAATNYNGSKPE
jgi:PTH1 family peptidyl-tRNA hydrolase